MGQFGGCHKDKKDFPAGYTCAQCLSDLQQGPGREPGRLHFLGQGVWVRLEYMTQLFFSGLLLHGGTAPLVPDGEVIHDWETRVMLISYPASAMMTGEAKQAYAAEPFSEDPCFITPEMTGAPVFKSDKSMWNGHASYGQDGWVTMEPESHFNWMVRGALQRSHFAFRQLPASYGVEIDSEKFLDAFSMTVDGERVTAKPWSMAPEDDVQNPF
ncbi:hypothetical protein BDY19DRAFT_866772, partial [Irpex rosettiformis]